MTQEPAAKTIVILANSRKHSNEQSGRCIAGIEIIDERAVSWVRPVSARSHGEVSEYERQYEDGSDPKVLDVVLVPFLNYAPSSYQTENWTLDPTRYWKRVGAVGTQDLDPFEDQSDLWLFDTPDTRYGLNDRVALTVAESLSDSLRLIHVEDLQYRVFAPGTDFGNSKRRVQASFTYRGVGYRAFVTDPIVERNYLARDDEFCTVGAAYLTVSLGEPYDGFSYKLVAAVIPG